jgi:hypothetical protein
MKQLVDKQEETIEQYCERILVAKNTLAMFPEMNSNPLSFYIQKEL